MTPWEPQSEKIERQGEQKWPQVSQRAPKVSQKGAKVSQKGAKGSQKGAKGSQKGAKGRPKRIQKPIFGKGAKNVSKKEPANIQKHAVWEPFLDQKSKKGHPKIDAKIDAEKWSKIDAKLEPNWSQNDPIFDEISDLFAKGCFWKNRVFP